MEDRIRKISKSKRLVSRDSFFIDTNKTITSIEVFDINEGDALRLKRSTMDDQYDSSLSKVLWLRYHYETRLFRSLLKRFI